jgi:hypothetical protein
MLAIYAMVLAAAVFYWQWRLPRRAPSMVANP